ASDLSGIQLVDGSAIAIGDVGHHEVGRAEVRFYALKQLGHEGRPCRITAVRARVRLLGEILQLVDIAGRQSELHAFPGEPASQRGAQTFTCTDDQSGFHHARAPSVHDDV